MGNKGHLFGGWSQCTSELWSIASIADMAAIAAGFATVTAVVVAWIGVTKTVRNSRDLAKKTQTLNMIVRGEITKIHEEAIKVLKEHPNDGAESIARLAVAKDQLEPEDRDKADALYEILNWYEYLAAGVRHDILSEEYLRNSSFTTIMRIWRDSRLFVRGVQERIERQEKRTSTFCEALEWLVQRWDEAGYDGELPKLKKPWFKRKLKQLADRFS